MKGAELLKTSRFKVTPFVSRYRTPAIIVIVILFVLEFTCSTLRSAGGAWGLSQYVSQASSLMYCLVAIVLTICYLMCAVAVWKRLRSMSAVSVRRQTMRILALRVTLSVLGYIVFVISSIVFVIYYRRPGARGIILSISYAAFNWSATMQVAATKPPEHSNSVSPSSSLNNNKDGKGSMTIPSELSKLSSRDASKEEGQSTEFFDASSSSSDSSAESHSEMDGQVEMISSDEESDAEDQV